jgi:hypothetical protein
MTQPLARLGGLTIAVALPSRGETGDTLREFYDDVQARREAIAAVDGPSSCGQLLRRDDHH